ncbi:MAG: hypothetical protein IT319_11845 [Anaerolineae bacterium]|nr:hypothetical protein [Anaerolineae bacterium]
MSTQRKIIVLAVVALIAVSSFTALAQDTGTQDWPPFGMMGRGGHGAMMGSGFHMMWDDDATPMFSAVAQALGIDEQTLISELQSGKTISELAQEKDIDLTTIWSAAQTQMQEHLQALVDAGTLTQAQADAHLSLMQSHWEDMPMFSGQGFGMMGGMWGNNDTHHGMMGRWH